MIYYICFLLLSSCLLVTYPFGCADTFHILNVPSNAYLELLKPDSLFYFIRGNLSREIFPLLIALISLFTYSTTILFLYRQNFFSKTKYLLILFTPFLLSIIGTNYWFCAIKNGISIALLIPYVFEFILKRNLFPRYFSVITVLFSILFHWSSLILLTAMLASTYLSNIKLSLLKIPYKFSLFKLIFFPFAIISAAFFTINVVFTKFYAYLITFGLSFNSEITYGRYLPIIVFFMLTLLLFGSELYKETSLRHVFIFYVLTMLIAFMSFSGLANYMVRFVISFHFVSMLILIITCRLNGFIALCLAVFSIPFVIYNFNFVISNSLNMFI